MAVGQEAREALLERDAELLALAAAIERAGAGQGRLLLIEGPPGIGKTTLLEQAAFAASEAGFAVLRAAGAELERGFAFGVVRQLLERAVRERPPAAGAAALGAELLRRGPDAAAPSAEAAFPLLHGLYWQVADLAAARPLALLVDDVHWADQPSQQWLAFLARRLDDLPVLLAVATRPPDADADAAGLAALALAPSRHELRPEPLSAAGVASLARAVWGTAPEPAFVAALQRATGGVPLLVAELGRALRDEGAAPAGPAAVERVAQVAPGAVTRSVMGRVRALGPDAVALVRAAAVLDRGGDLELVAALAGLERSRAAALVEALAHDLTADEHVTFAHPVLREAILQAQPAGLRAETHRRAAEELHARDAAPEAIAAQLLAAPEGLPGWAPAVLERAAAEALAAGAVRDAVALLRRAVAETRRGGAVSAARLHALGRAEALARDPQALETLREAQAAAEPARRGAVASDVARALSGMLRTDEALAVLDAALLEAPDREARLRLEADRQFTAMLAGRPAPIPDEELTAATPAERALMACLPPAIAAATEDLDRGARLARAAWDGGRLVTEEGPESPAVMAAIAGLMFADAFDEAAAMAEQAVAEARRRGSITGYVAALSLRSHNAVRRGDVAGAAADAEEALAIEAEHPGTFLEPVTMTFAIEALIETGELDRGFELLAGHGLDGDLPPVYLFDLVRERRGRLRLAAGDVDGAIEDLVPAAARLNAVAGPYGNVASHLALALLAAGRREEARAPAADDLARALRTGRARARSIALRAVALTADPVDATGLREAASVAAEAGARLEEARALVDLGRVLRRRRDVRDAREVLRQALDLATRAGARALAGAARDELLAAGGRPRRVLLSGAAALTPRERRVAELAAGGASNREIAEALFVTVRTVEMHLSAAYRKLGIAARRELGAALS